jgi:CHAT domain-containing protein
MGKLAQLLQSEQRHQEALSLIEQAIVLAYANNDRVLSAKLEAQLAEIFRLQGDSKRALDAYKQAVDDLHSVRTDIPISLPDGRSVLVAMIEPIYRNYVDLLLQTVSSADTTADQQLLMKAIDSMEAIKEADMQDFFLGRCSVSSEIHLDWKYQKFPGATIVYPILLNDRLEIIVKTDEKLIRHTVNVGADEVKSKAIELGEILHTGKDFRGHSKQLNEWLYLPLKQDLLESKTQVIIYVPDRSLRAIPLAAFSDGKNFVVEQYPVVTLPSLQIQNLVRNRQQKQSRALLAGLSKPDGSAIDSLPNNLVGKISGKKLEREALVEQLSLPSVEKEINTVSNNIENTKLLNNQFTASALKNDISTGEYGKVHIASHGYFGKNAKDSFIMAYDQNVNLIDFKNSLDADSLKREPIDLLTLSACKTAEGDDRMLLGFSGLAVKSNVLSAVGSLWSINDDATMEFMRLFYQGLDHSLNKAEAMRDAQVNMIKSKKFRHPFYWSPFILIGNWQ